MGVRNGEFLGIRRWAGCLPFLGVHTSEEVAASSEEGANCVHGSNIGDIEMF